jgi:hypothetical protein
MLSRRSATVNEEMAESEPFRFFTERRLVALTGLKARNLPELLHHIEAVPGASIFHHTHSHYLSHHFEKPLVYNEFAEWVSHALQEKRLAEQLAAIDLFGFTTIRELRCALFGIISNFLHEAGGRLRECPPGDEFHFARAKSFILPTKLSSSTVREFREVLPHVSNTSLYFHFFQARLRLEKRTNDFSAWLESIGEQELAARIDRLNPYDYTLDELRTQIVHLAEGRTPE